MTFVLFIYRWPFLFLWYLPSFSSFDSSLTWYATHGYPKPVLSSRSTTERQVIFLFNTFYQIYATELILPCRFRWTLCLHDLSTCRTTTNRNVLNCVLFFSCLRRSKKELLHWNIDTTVLENQTFFFFFFFFEVHLQWATFIGMHEFFPTCQ